MSPFSTESVHRSCRRLQYSRSARALRGTVALLSALMFSSTLVHAAPSKRDEALAHFDRGNTAFENGQNQAALEAYRTAWSLHRAFDIACNLGRVEVELGHARDAAEHLAYCLENFSASTHPEMRKAEENFRELFERVRTQVGALRFEVDPPAAHVLVDGRPASSSSSQGLVFVEPGSRRVRAELSGYAPVERTIPVVAGQEREVALKLERASSEAAAMPPPSPPATQPSGSQDGNVNTGSAKTIVIIAGSTLAVAGLGLGVGMTIHASNLDADVDRLQERSIEQFGENGCNQNPAELCMDLDDKVDARANARTLSTVGFVAGGVFAAGTVAAILLWPSQSSAESALRVEPAVGPGVAQLSVSGVF